jgi:hypothetical protein
MPRLLRLRQNLRTFLLEQQASFSAAKQETHSTASELLVYTPWLRHRDLWLFITLQIRWRQPDSMWWAPIGFWQVGGEIVTLTHMRARNTAAAIITRKAKSNKVWTILEFKKTPMISNLQHSQCTSFTHHDSFFRSVLCNGPCCWHFLHIVPMAQLITANLLCLHALRAWGVCGSHSYRVARPFLRMLLTPTSFCTGYLKTPPQKRNKNE